MTRTRLGQTALVAVRPLNLFTVDHGGYTFLITDRSTRTVGGVMADQSAPPPAPPPGYSPVSEVDAAWVGAVPVSAGRSPVPIDAIGIRAATGHHARCVPPPGYELKKKKRFYKRVWFWLLVAVVLIVIIVIAVVAGVANDAVNSKHTVGYKVTGTGKADITYSSWTLEATPIRRSMSRAPNSHGRVPWRSKAACRSLLSRPLPAIS